ncbi:thiol reductase thioredoxin [archaeon SCG-AAA382B04]|nr:thiol reductase thioredoxin [archaeon SCG-AAA382B04]
MSKVKLKDFYSDWCPPCKKQSPIIEELKDEYQQVEFQKIDVDENEELAQEYNVSAIPTLIIECDDEIKQRYVGFTKKQEIKDSLEKTTSNC